MESFKKIFLAFVLLFSVAGYAQAASNYWFSPLPARSNGSELDAEPVLPAPNPALLVSAAAEVTDVDSEWILIGLTLPSGASGKIKHLTICYQVETDIQDRTYISEVSLTQMTTPDEVQVIYEDDTDLTSMTPTCYTARTNIKKVNGTITLGLRMVFGSTEDFIKIGGIKLRASK